MENNKITWRSLPWWLKGIVMFLWVEIGIYALALAFGFIIGLTETV